MSRWHRRIGVVAALLVLLVAATGVLVNHGDALRLGEHRLHAQWLQRLYGLKPPALVAAQPLGTHWISQWDRQLFIDARPAAAPDVEQMLGAFVSGEAWAVADRTRLWLLTPEGALVDRLAYPGGFVATRAAANGDAIVLRAAGGTMLQADPALTGFGPPAAGEVRWSENRTLPADVAAALAGRQQGAGVSAERLLLDVHAGRWMGAAGIWVIDLAALALLFLAISGVIGAWRGRRKATAQSHGQMER